MIRLRFSWDGAPGYELFTGAGGSMEDKPKIRVGDMRQTGQSQKERRANPGRTWIASFLFSASPSARDR